MDSKKEFTPKNTQNLNETKTSTSPSHIPDPQQDQHIAIVSKTRIIRGLWLSAGILCMIVGLIGVVVPGLPTTPFMLLAAACFARSSQELYDWILDNPMFGKHVRRFRDGGGVSKRVKTIATTTIVVFVMFAVTFGIPKEMVTVKVIVALSGIYGVWFIRKHPTFS